VKFSALAIDFDGTAATADVLDPDVRAALGELRERGIVVILATGRIVEDLRRVAGALHFVDAVVAENGAVVLFPDSGYSTVNGDPPPESLLAALREDGIPFEAGRVVVEADANQATRILSIIRRLELPLVIAFNRGRLMVLPQTISKATGVRQALTILRLSPHNAVAIGDAENDHELLRTCEVGVAVGWGSAALKVSADAVLDGDGPPALAPYLRALADRQRVPTGSRTRRRLLLGHASNGQPLALDLKGRNVLVAGDPKSGKSWVTGLLCEQLILQGYCVCVIDPEGDYVSLVSLPGVTVFGGANPLPRPMDLLRALRHSDVNIVIDLSHVPLDVKVDYVRSVLPALTMLRRHTGLPHRIVLDEAHYFLHGLEPGFLDAELGGYTLVTYRASQLHPDVLSAAQAVVITRESDPDEVRALFALCRSCQGTLGEAEWERLLGGLALGAAALLPITDEAGGEIRRIHLATRLTPHVRHIAKYIDIPVSDSRAFTFWRDGSLTGERARTLRELVRRLEGSDVSAFDGHLRRGDFSRWVGEVFGDYPLAATIRNLEESYRSGARGADVPAELALAVRARYEFLDPVQPAKVDG
jgi:hydroxymethylpyrimidine pyrophosphatase-like HAD family hydrolase